MAQKNVKNYSYVEGYNESKAKSYFNSATLDPIEGIWQSTDGFKYSIEKDVDYGTRSSNKYRVIILNNNSGNNFWKVTYIKSFIEKTAVESVFNMEYYTNSSEGGNLSIQSIIGILEGDALFTFNYIKNSYTGFSYKVMLVKLYPASKSANSNDNTTIKKEKSTGTGFAISSDGFIVTNYHVIENATSIKVKGINGSFTKAYSAKVIQSDKNNDLAIIKIDDYSFSSLGIIPYTIKSLSANVGENIFVLGYPLTATMGEEIKLTNGIISSKSGFQGDITSYQMTAPIQPGNSGAPMFDKDGNVVGIVNAKHYGAENAGYAIKTSYLMNLVDAAPSSINLPSINTLKGKQLTDQVSVIKKYVYIIEVN
ncbi:MAG: trypsin-like peptidase domain-containing protein [Crenarchaeota archaeon]|jgi:S1-C subfamily serine protease|nr:trypsin-like peptidase domain-containing protein [Thermoproteota archaeon]